MHHDGRGQSGKAGGVLSTALSARRTAKPPHPTGGRAQTQFADQWLVSIHQSHNAFGDARSHMYRSDRRCVGHGGLFAIADSGARLPIMGEIAKAGSDRGDARRLLTHIECTPHTRAARFRPEPVAACVTRISTLRTAAGSTTAPPLAAGLVEPGVGLCATRISAPRMATVCAAVASLTCDQGRPEPVTVRVTRIRTLCTGSSFDSTNHARSQLVVNLWRPALLAPASCARSSLDHALYSQARRTDVGLHAARNDAPRTSLGSGFELNARSRSGLPRHMASALLASAPCVPAPDSAPASIAPLALAAGRSHICRGPCYSHRRPAHRHRYRMHRSRRSTRQCRLGPARDAGTAGGIRKMAAVVRISHICPV